MNTGQSDPKKWFVYLSDHHEGPFTHDEIASKLRSAYISPATYVWSYGMEDWLALAQIPTLQPLAKTIKRQEKDAKTLELDVPVEDRAKPVKTAVNVLAKPAAKAKDTSFFSFGDEPPIVLRDGHLREFQPPPPRWQ